MLPKWATHRAMGTMVVMLLFGATFSIGHHFFYQSLSGKPPPSSVYFSHLGGGLTGQQVNLAVGSVFAFLVNSAFGAVITTAADQALWATVRTKTLKLGTIDNLATATTGIWSIFDFRLWRESPIRMILVTILWLISITSFITPATLNVVWSATTSTSLMRVPQIDFTSLNFANIQSQPSLSPMYAYSNPQYAVLQTVAGSTTGGYVLPISSPYDNATWLLEFPGPALSCESINKASALYHNISDNILNAMTAGAAGCVRSFGYLSWVPTVPDINSGAISSLPFPSLFNISDSKLSSAVYEPPSLPLGPVSRDAEVLELYIAAMPGMDQNTNFTYVNNIQSVNITTQGSFNNISAMEPIAGTSPLEINQTLHNPPMYNVQGVENYAYEAVMDAFGRMFVGAIVRDFDGDAYGNTVGVTIAADMASTPLLRTKDFNFLQPLIVTGNSKFLKGFADSPILWNGNSVEAAANSTIPMAGVMEELFRNATVSLMSNSLLQPNYSSPYAPPDVPVTQTHYALIYSYAANTLWLAYGIALGMTLLSILLGVVSIYHNSGFSYMSKFSTILRVTHCIDLSDAIQPEDKDGKDPTPRYIKNLTVSFPPTGDTVRYRRATKDSEGGQLR
ncbi:hypothetical protein T069G_09435 [Trichoderma breve]|uniref:Uncharacterized protein n=1 Tax=Trichoderma breve TaxID=2034170 RepID=A0A9W9B580_9HYPO|nr:hypothetical protein T069G_09435 [Trichoderma breve]KAJ4856067.1 hypothetical protein T069G_09435 [Trichoderma breve]